MLTVPDTPNYKRTGESGGKLQMCDMAATRLIMLSQSRNRLLAYYGVAGVRKGSRTCLQNGESQKAQPLMIPFYAQVLLQPYIGLVDKREGEARARTC